MHAFNYNPDELVTISNKIKQVKNKIRQVKNKVRQVKVKAKSEMGGWQGVCYGLEKKLYLIINFEYIKLQFNFEIKR